MDPDFDEILASCLEHWRVGDDPAVEAAIARYPDLGPRIRTVLRVQEALVNGPAPTVGSKITPHRPGSAVGGYEVIEVLGRGGSGVVYLVWDPRLERRLALKLLHSIDPTPKELERFRRETRALAMLRHPGVVSIHGAGTTQEGLPFFVMDHVEGASLDVILRNLEGRDPRALTDADLLSVEVEATPGEGYVHAAVRLVARVADALERAHRSGIVHRDVKPGNILIDGAGEPHLIDFGIARWPGAQTVTRDGAAPGTPGYMAPESVEGDGASMGPRSDVFSLGVVLYQLLALRAPFTDGSTIEVLAAIRERDPKPLRSYNPDIARDLTIVVDKAMQKDPQSRYANAGSLRDDLEAVLEGRPIRARSAGRVERLLKWSRRRPAAALACALGFTIVALMTSIALWGWNSLRRGDAALREFDRVNADRQASQARVDANEWQLNWHLDKAQRGSIHEDRQRVADKTIECELLIREAEHAYRAVLKLPILGGAAKRRLSVAIGRAIDLAENSGKPHLASRMRERALTDGIRFGSWRDVRFRMLPGNAEMHLFRYEEVRSLMDRGAELPRLVPVPVNDAGVPFEFSVGGFQPGDPCLLVTRVGETESHGLAPGDLILDIDGQPVTEAAYVLTLAEGGPAACEGIRPLDRVIEIDGESVDSSFEWGMVRSPGEDHLFHLRAQAHGGTPIEITVDRKSVFGGFLPDWIGEFLPAGEKRIELSRVVDVPVAGPEDYFGMTVGPIEALFSQPAPREIVLRVLSDGEPRICVVEQGAKFGLEVERTAYPLPRLEHNRVANGRARLPPGSYLCLFSAVGREDLRRPFVVETVGPCDDEPIEIVACLPSVGSAPRGFVCIDSGTALLQGDANVCYAGASSRESISRFWIARHEVTVAEWWEYLDAIDLHARVASYCNARIATWKELCESEPNLPSEWPVPATPDGRPWEISFVAGHLLPPSRSHWESPIVGVMPIHIQRYIDWRNECVHAAGQAWRFRLATESEWEKAARGVDGRWLPWGNEFDFALTNSFAAGERGRAGRARVMLEPISSFPTDESPYGVRDLAGSASELVHSTIPGFDAWPVYKGGSWASPNAHEFRAASRNPSTGAYPHLGFRLVAVPCEVE